MMRCAACNRNMTYATGWLGKLPLGPICWARIKSIKPKKRHQAVKAERVEIDQLDLFGDGNEPNR